MQSEETLINRLHTVLSEAMSKEGAGIEIVLETLATVCDQNADSSPDSKFIAAWRITAKHLRDTKSMLSYNCPYP